MAKKKFNEPPAIPEVETPTDKVKRITGRTPKDVFGKESKFTKFTLDDIKQATEMQFTYLQENDRFFDPGYDPRKDFSYPVRYSTGIDLRPEDMKAYRSEPPKPVKPKVYGKRMKSHVIDDIHLQCEKDCHLCWEDSTCEHCVAYTRRIGQLNEIARKADTSEAERKIKEAIEARNQARDELNTVRNIVTDTATALSVDLGEAADADRWSNDNMRRVVAAAKELKAQSEAVIMDRDRFNREADHLAEALEEALESAEYWRERAAMSEKIEVVSALRRVAA